MGSLDTNSKPFISIIIPTLNEEKYIGVCLDSLARQTYPKDNFEIIIVDGLSKDSTIEVAHGFSDRLNLRFFTNPRVRSTFAFNKGVDEAKGDLFMIVNAHSYLQADFIEEDVKTFFEVRKTEKKLAGVGGIYINEYDNAFGKLIGLLYYSSFSGASSCRYKMNPHFSDSVIFGVFDKEIVMKNGKFDEDFVAAGNDNELAKRLRRKGFRLFTNPKIVAHYVTRNSLRKFVKQTFNYGVAQGIIVRKGNFKPQLNTASFWFIPIVFLLYELILPSIFVFSNVNFEIAVAPLIAYLIIDFIVSLNLMIKTKSALCLWLAPTYFLFHNILGLSALAGLFLKKRAFL